MNPLVNINSLISSDRSGAKPTDPITRPTRAEMEEAVRTLIRRDWKMILTERDWLNPPACVARAYQGAVCRAMTRILTSSCSGPLRKSPDMTRWCCCVTSISCPTVTLDMALIVARAHIGYLPRDRVVGISKLALGRVEVYSRRLQIQERMTAEIANTLDKVLGPHGVAVVIEGVHGCTTSRGCNAVGMYPGHEPHAGSLSAIDRKRARSSCLQLARGVTRPGSLSAEVSSQRSEPVETDTAMPAQDATRSVDLAALGDAELAQLACQRHGGAFRTIMQRHNRRLYPGGPLCSCAGTAKPRTSSRKLTFAHSAIWPRSRASSSLSRLGSRASLSMRHWDDSAAAVRVPTLTGRSRAGPCPRRV